MTLTNKTIRTIELQNFKGYRRDTDEKSKCFEFDNADLILITGKNGVGKTSLLEAINWTMNQEGIPKKYLTENKTDGLVLLNDSEFLIGGKSTDQEDLLKKVSTFFFQEHITTLACNEVIQLLEPDNKPAQAMKKHLKSLQNQLELWQQQLQQMKYRKDYEAERKKFAGIITKITLSLKSEHPAKPLLKSTTLTLKNGNLQSRWYSQIRNLSNTLSELSEQVQVIGESIPAHLLHIGKCLNEIQIRALSVKPEEAQKQEFDRAFIDRLMQLPADLEVKWAIEADTLGSSKMSFEVDPSSLDALIIESNRSPYLVEIEQLTSKQEILRSEYRNVSEAISKLSDASGLENWLNSFHTNIGQWLSAFDNDAEKVDLDNIVVKLTEELAQLGSLTQSKLQHLHVQRVIIEEQGKEISSKIEQFKLYNYSAEQLNRYASELKPLFADKGTKVSEVINYAKNKYIEIPESQSETNEIHTLESLIDTFQRWSVLEHDREVDEKNVTQPEVVDHAESLLASAIKVCKQESGTNSQLLNLISEIPAVELQNLTANMNSLLDKFHFPKGFLPIKLENIGTEKKAEWTFKTKNDVKFADLSTGQKTQLAICWTINLNLALSDVLNHRVVGFDDCTTSLDMNQLIPAAVLLRKLAYANEGDKWKRQVIVTSHHEDLTNRLLDFLLPPEGRTMRVIQFEDWSPETGPSFNCYNVEMGEQTPSNDRIQSAIKRLFT